MVGKTENDKVPGASGGAGKTGAETETKTYENLGSAAIEGEWQPGKDAPKGGQGGGGAAGDAQQVAMLSKLLETGFVVVARHRGPHWALSPARKVENEQIPSEADMLAAAIDDCIRAYAPDFNMGPGLTLAFVSAVVIGPRVFMDWNMADQEREKEKAGGGDGGKS